MQNPELILETIVSDMFAENAYLAQLSGRDDCLVVDPGFDVHRIVERLSERKLTPAAILNTHGHADHIDLNCKLTFAGVILYILLCGFPPFYGDNDAQMFKRIKAGSYKFLSPYWDPISADAKDFVSKLLVVDWCAPRSDRPPPTQRPQPRLLLALGTDPVPPPGSFHCN